MKLNPNVVALLIAAAWGSVVIPWGIAAKKMGGAEIYMMLGGGYVTAGLLWCLVEQRTPRFVTEGVLWGVVFIVPYVIAAGMCTYMWGDPANANRFAVLAAITGVYPLFTAVTAFIVRGERFTWPQVFFFITTLVGVAGLGLAKGK